ncbi:hypothetical protein [Umezawaea beigongshangensis]|uniref:hypothetical protein n=1 Tax=Umezawaea beigongshangensis TaxID=2780383 RepID=UPI0018F227C1|nr:hypothetical protein [Umezawaea beigongshangensis]
MRLRNGTGRRRLTDRRDGLAGDPELLAAAHGVSVTAAVDFSVIVDSATRIHVLDPCRGAGLFWCG